MDIKEESLKKALNATRIPELPKQDKGGDGKYWLEAIVLVRKRDCSLSYAIAKRGTDGKIFYTSDFGTMSPIIGLVSIHPYEYLNREKYEFNGGIEEKRDKLIKFIGGDEEAKESVGKMTDDEVETAMLNIAVESQKVDKDVAKTHERIIEAVNGRNESQDIDDSTAYKISEGGKLAKKQRVKRVSKKD